jgi:hypothetical protein
VKASLMEINANGLHIVLDPIGSNAGIDTGIEKSLQLAAILSLSDPIDVKAGKFTIISFVSQEQPVELDGSLTFSIVFASQEAQLFQKYRIHKEMFGLITTDKDGNPVHYSSTLRR